MLPLDISCRRACFLFFEIELGIILQDVVFLCPWDCMHSTNIAAEIARCVSCRKSYHMSSFSLTLKVPYYCLLGGNDGLRRIVRSVLGVVRG